MLEIGCATGDYIAKIRQLGWQTYGVELSEQAAQLAISRFGLDVFAGDLFQAGFPSGKFDVVALWMVLEHLYNPVATLREIRRVLRDDGVVLLNTVLIDHIGYTVFRDYWYDCDQPRHLYLFSKETLRAILEKAGFRVDRFAYKTSTNSLRRSLEYVARDAIGGTLGESLGRMFKLENR